MLRENFRNPNLHNILKFILVRSKLNVLEWGFTFFNQPTLHSNILMSKLGTTSGFFDLSDYGRPLGKYFAKLLVPTKFTSIHVTFLFGLSGLLGILCILKQYYFTAGLFFLLKSVIDASDGELARLKQKPSYTGRYLDSIFDIILNLLIIVTIGILTKTPFYLTFLAFICIQLQGTLYNYYYVILRNRVQGGDTTSKIFEYKKPKAFPYEKQISVDILFYVYYGCYGFFDKTIHFLDPTAYKVKTFPNWFMTFLSIYGLGFQLLIIAILLPLHLMPYIIPFFIFFSIFIFVFIGIRRFYLPIVDL